MSEQFPIGKLPPAWLARLLEGLPRRDPRVLIGPAPGEDAAVVDVGDRLLVISTDPITFAVERIGWYAVHVNANDVAVLGARPRWFLATLLLPERAATDTLVTAIMTDLVRTCESLEVTLCGGHTEITAGLDRPIVVGQMLGEVSRDRLVRKSHLRPGDLILLTQGVAIEGTAILARDLAARLAGRVAPELLARAARLLDTPGISVVQAALTALDAGEVHGMHDPTEGGLASGLAELATAAGVGLVAEVERVPILPETAAVAGVLGLDPLRLIASGALLIGTGPRDADAVIAALAQRDIPARVIAEARPPGEGCWWRLPDGRLVPLEPAARDEIARAFEETGTASD